MKYVLYKIKEENKEKWIAWLKELDSTHRNQVEHILRLEGISDEVYLVFQIGNEDYCLGIELAKRLKPYDTSSLSTQHSKMKKECLELIDKGAEFHFTAES
jgi:TnpA family transposase